MQKYQITKRREKPFQGDEGKSIPYCWYKAVRLADGVTIEFGSKNLAMRPDEEHELDVEKTETATGFKYRDVTGQ